MKDDRLWVIGDGSKVMVIGDESKAIVIGDGLKVMGCKPFILSTTIPNLIYMIHILN